MSEEDFPISEEIKRQQQAQKRRRTRYSSDEILKLWLKWFVPSFSKNYVLQYSNEQLILKTYCLVNCCLHLTI